MAKNILAVQTTTFQNRKADVYFRFFNCILLWTALEAMRVRLECLPCRWRCDGFSFHDRNSQMLFPLTRTEYAAAQGLPWYQWASLNAPVAPAQVYNPYLWKHCAWQRILCLKSMAGLLLWCGSWSVTFPYALSFLPVFISCIGFIIHPSKAFWIKLLPVVLFLV